MTKSKLGKIALASLAVLSGGLGIDTAYARGGGGLGGGHMGGFGGGAVGAFSAGHIGGGMPGLGGLTRPAEMGGAHISFERSDFGHRNALSGNAPLCEYGSISTSCQPRD